MNTNSRSPAVAGRFYPESATVLAHEIAQMLTQVPDALCENAKAIIVPHAGYIYSGQVAAEGYAALAKRRQTITRVVLLGPAHRVAVKGLALPSCLSFTTPLGEVPLDQPSITALMDLAQIEVNDSAHAQEHSLEVQLPFLQSVLSQFSLVPLVVGHATPQQIAEVLERLWGGDETLIVVSSDLSHYLPYVAAQEIDTQTARQIVNLGPDISHTQACGASPVNGLLLAARQHGLQGKLIRLRNSGDASGERSRVVGYAAFAFFEKEHPESIDPLGLTLLTLVRNAIGTSFKREARAVTAHPKLAELAASFVTLTLNGQLRGCIGSLQAHRPLAIDVSENALAAAFRDSRFTPLKADEFVNIRVEVSLLEPPEPLEFLDESDAIARLRPGLDGLILTHNGRRATFLPQVWESLPDPHRFIEQLKLKAGLTADFWDETITLARYRVQKWKEI